MQTLSIFALTILGVSALPIPEPVIDDRAGAQAIADAGQALGDKIGFAVGGGVGGLLAGILGVKGSQGEDIVRNGAGQIGEVVGNKIGGGLGGFFGGKIFNVDSDRLDKSSILNSAVNNRNSINSDNRDDRDNRDISRSAQIDDRRNDDRRDDRSDISRDDRIRIDDGGQRGSTLADTLSNY